MLALNFQSSSELPMLINWAKFRENGGCGYNLRPQYLNDIVRASGEKREKKMRCDEMRCDEIVIVIVM
jgi:hypothetical protein